MRRLIHGALTKGDLFSRCELLTHRVYYGRQCLSEVTSMWDACMVGLEHAMLQHASRVNSCVVSHCLRRALCNERGSYQRRQRHIIGQTRNQAFTDRSAGWRCSPWRPAANDRPATLAWHRYAARSLAHHCQIERQTSHTDTPAAAFCDSSVHPSFSFS